MAKTRAKAWLDRWVEPGAQKIFAVLLALIALGVACWLPLRPFLEPAPRLTALGPFALTPAGQHVTMFEFSAARDRALLFAPVASQDDPNQRQRVEVYLWDVATRRLRSLGRFDGVAAPSLAWVADGKLGRTADGGSSSTPPTASC